MKPHQPAKGSRNGKFKHGQSGSTLYHVWEGMKARCKPSKSENWMRNWYNRGIRVCPDWQANFSSFAAWAKESGYTPLLQIERKNNDAGYCPENCRWATRKEQQANRRDPSLWLPRRVLAIVSLLVLSTVSGVADKVPTVGIASFYGYELQGRLQANGRPFNATKLTCASWHHPLGTLLRVTNISNGRTVLVTVTDRGPARRLKRIVDLSRAAFQSIDNLDNGLCTVQIERLNK